MLIFPSIISCDLLNLERTIGSIDAHVDGYHIDVMDDHFVPNLTWGPMFISALRRITSKPFQIHLMIDDPKRWIDRVAFHAGDSFVFHLEALHDDDAVRSIVNSARNHGWRVGLALNPPTLLESIYPYIQDLDEILFMSVHPGFSGQSFIDVTAKVREFIAHFHTSQSKKNHPLICMDGGVGPSNIGLLAGAGVEAVGVAAAIFGEGDPVQNIAQLRRLAS